MSKVIIIIGMPGSGKSTYYQKNLKNIISENCFFDDYHSSSSYFEISNYYIKLKNNLSIGNICAISDIEYCNKNRLDKAIEGIKEIEKELKVPIEIKFICFENNPIFCKININKRNRDCYLKELESVDRLTQVYEYPENAEIIPISI